MCPTSFVAGRYLYITIVYNLTYSVALFALFMFYLGTHEMLAPFNPLLKFILVKSVVFFTFWQVGRTKTLILLAGGYDLNPRPYGR